MNSLPSRRTLVRSASWAAPVIASSAFVPAYAASCVQGTLVAARPGTGTADYQEATDKWTVPAGITQLTFAVVGGGGGGAYHGGSGASVTGILSVQPGQVLTFVTAAGGVGFGGKPVEGSQEGGHGYGNGGNSPAPAAYTNRAGGTGGGGSAILLDGRPVVVAGGGGGDGIRWSGADTLKTTSAGTPDPAYSLDWRPDDRAWGGDAGVNGSFAGGNGATGTAHQDGTGATDSYPGASGASAKGQGGATSAPGSYQGKPYTFSGGEVMSFVKEQTVLGNAGGSSFQANGGNATSATGRVEVGNKDRPYDGYRSYSGTVRSGAGGGGYGGGGSGSIYLAMVATPGPKVVSAAVAVEAAAGGAGGSFVDEKLVTQPQIAPANNGSSQPGVRSPGKITISWGC